MANRTTITLRDIDKKILEDFKKSLDLPTSQTLSVILMVVDIIKKEQEAGHNIVFETDDGYVKALAFNFLKSIDAKQSEKDEDAA